MVQSYGRTFPKHNRPSESTRSFASQERDIPPPDGANHPEWKACKSYIDSDLYNPRWVRGQGVERKAWCGMCKPGVWLKIGITFWRHKQYRHGICAKTKARFE